MTMTRSKLNSKECEVKMTRVEARKMAHRCAFHLLNNGHNNEFLYEDEDLDEKDQERLQLAWDDLLERLRKTGES